MTDPLIEASPTATSRVTNTERPLVLFGFSYRRICCDAIKKSLSLADAWKFQRRWASTTPPPSPGNFEVNRVFSRREVASHRHKLDNECFFKRRLNIGLAPVFTVFYFDRERTLERRVKLIDVLDIGWLSRLRT